MTWESFYLICFLVGFLLSVVSFAGQIFDLHLPGAGDHDGDWSGAPHEVSAHEAVHGDANASHAVHTPSKFSFSTITAFLAWFGGTGYLLSRYTPIWLWLALALAAIAGLAGASVVFWLLAKLMAHDRTLNPADYDMIGVLGSVTSPVRDGGVGEMIFTQDGARRAAPIRSDAGGSIERGIDVVVTRYERGIAYVRRWDELTGAPDESPRASGL